MVQSIIEQNYDKSGVNAKATQIQQEQQQQRRLKDTIGTDETMLHLK
jgi:hypothetical protein